MKYWVRGAEIGALGFVELPDGAIPLEIKGYLKMPDGTLLPLPGDGKEILKLREGDKAVAVTRITFLEPVKEEKPT